MADKARSIVDTILGEAVSGTREERFADMLGIASTIANRATITGATPESVVAAPGQYSAYGNRLPSGARAYRSLAEQAWEQVRTIGPVHQGTYYATPSATKNLPAGLQAIARTTGHQYFTDPMQRSIRTARGFVKPSVEAVARVAENVTRATGSVVNAAAQQIGLTPAQRGLGLEGLTPNAGYNAIGSYNRSALDPSLSGVLNSIGRDPRFDGLSVNSGYRSPAYNAKVGGARKSQHIQGKAVDVKGFRGLSKDLQAALIDKAMTQGARGVGLYATGALHLDTRKSPAAWGPNGYTKNPLSTFPSHLQGAVSALRSLQPGQPYTPAHPSNIPTPSARPGAPVGKVTRAPLSAPVAAAAPSAARFGPATPSPAARAAAAVATKGARVTAQPSVARTAPALGSVSAPLGPAGSMARAQDPATMTAMGGAVSPARPDNRNYAGPKGQFNVTPNTDVVLGPIDVGPARAPVPAAPVSVVAAARALTAPMVAPQAVRAPAPVNRVNPVKQARLAPVQPAHRLAPAARIAPPSQISSPAKKGFNSSWGPTPGPTVGSVYGGTIGTATATDGNRVTRDAFGNIGITNAYGVTSWSTPDGRGIARMGQPNGTGIGARMANPFGGMPPGALAQQAKGILGSLAGAAIGGAVAGPLGSVVGGYLASQAVRGVNPVSAVARLGYREDTKSKPGYTHSNRSDAGMRSISPGAANAIGKGKAGLY